MWPTNLINDVFLKNLYGAYPPLTNLEVTSLDFSRNGPSVELCFLSDLLPINSPKKWPEFNRVSLLLYFSDISNLNLKEISTLGYSKFFCDGELFSIEGAVKFNFNFKHCRLQGLMPVNIVD